MYDEYEEEQHLVEATQRLREGRKLLAMTVYTIQHRRRTPVQVRAVLDRASRAIRRSELVRARRKTEVAVH
jgi:hypothetical protein